MAATRSSPAFSTAVPSAGSASTSSPLARATSSMAPNTSVWASATARHHADRRAGDGAQLGDVARPPGSHLDHRHLGVVGRVSSVRGTPSSLLNDRRLAAVRRDGAVARPRRSLTRGLADRAGDADHRDSGEPVSGRGPAERRQGQPRVSATTTDGSPSTLARPRARPPRAGRSGRGDEVVAVALGHEGHEELARARRARLSIVAPSTLERPAGRFEPATGHPGDLVQGQAHPPVVP